MAQGEGYRIDDKNRTAIVVHPHVNRSDVQMSLLRESSIRRQFMLTSNSATFYFVDGVDLEAAVQAIFDVLHKTDS